MLTSQIGYEQDFYAWLRHNAALIRQGKFAEIDTENIAEELEGMARRDRRQLMSRLAVLLMHLLKWQFQESLRSRSWELTIEEQREKIKLLLQESPSLKHEVDERLADAYRLAIVKAEKETGLPRKTFPIICPYQLAEALDNNFYPQE
jgi:hypothetical protein